MGLAVGKMAVPEIRAAVEKIFDRDAAISQFRNENGASTAGPDALWEVRLAAAKALGRDMFAEIRARAKETLADLRKEALHPANWKREYIPSQGGRGRRAR